MKNLNLSATKMYIIQLLCDVILMLTISGMVTMDNHFASNFCSALTFGPTEADGDFCLEQQRGCGCGRGRITLDSSCLQQVCPHIVLTPCLALMISPSPNISICYIL